MTQLSLTRIRLSRLTIAQQMKLAVSAPDDIFEWRPDMVAILNPNWACLNKPAWMAENYPMSMLRNNVHWLAINRPATLAKLDFPMLELLNPSYVRKELPELAAVRLATQSADLSGVDPRRLAQLPCAEQVIRVPRWKAWIIKCLPGAVFFTSYTRSQLTDPILTVPSEILNLRPEGDRGESVGETTTVQ